jgi:flagellar biosynthesis/type III secretory pathway protein FliH
MFDVFGDEIVFEGHTIATLNSRAIPSLLSEACSYLSGMQDHEKELEETATYEFDRGKVAGIAEAEDSHASALVDAKEEAHSDGFKEGYAKALADAANAADASRILALITELASAHDLLLPIVHGVTEGQFRRRPAKLSEAKKAASSVLSTLRIALHEFRKDNAK